MTIKEAAERLVSAHAKAGSPLRDYLKPGLMRSEVEERFGAIGLVEPSELVDLYAWHNGIDEERWSADGHRSFLCPLPFERWCSLDKAITDYKRLKNAWQDTRMFADYLAGHDPGFGYWQTQWFPLFISDESCHAIDCGGLHTGRVWHFFFESGQYREGHASLIELLGDCTQAFDDGICWWDQARDELTRKPRDEDL
jgi:hypothetical protein